MNEIDELIVKLTDEKTSTYRIGFCYKFDFDIFSIGTFINTKCLSEYDLLVRYYTDIIVYSRLERMWIEFNTYKIILHKVINLIYFILKEHNFTFEHTPILVQQLRSSVLYFDWVDIEMGDGVWNNMK